MLQSQQFTYPEVGQTSGTAPDGYRITRRSRQLRPDTEFAAAAHVLLSWEMHTKAGLSVEASSIEVRTGAVVVMRLGPGRLGISIPCRVVYVIDEPDRRGFAYGTLPGHPESGEESFVLSRQPDGSVLFTITAFSRPATVLARLGGPLTNTVQRFMTSRYLTAVDS